MQENDAAVETTAADAAEDAQTKTKTNQTNKKQKPNNNEAARPKQEIQEVGRRTHLPQSE
jgi:hypothetical protein